MTVLCPPHHHQLFEPIGNIFKYYERNKWATGFFFSGLSHELKTITHTWHLLSQVHVSVKAEPFYPEDTRSSQGPAWLVPGWETSEDLPPHSLPSNLSTEVGESKNSRIF